MSFEADLKAKAYELVEDKITLDAFKAWYREAMANAATLVFGEAEESEQTDISRMDRPEALKALTERAAQTEDFGDYRKSPTDVDEGDPVWTTGTGDQGRWPR
jgi:hypothetical protein